MLTKLIREKKNLFFVRRLTTETSLEYHLSPRRSFVLNEVLDIRKKEQLMQAFYSVEQIVSKNYLHNLQDYQIKQISKELANKKVSSITRLVKLDKYVINKQDNNLEKLGMVYSALSGGNSSLVYIIDSKDNQVDLYLGVVNYEGDIGSLAASKKPALTVLFFEYLILHSKSITSPTM